METTTAEGLAADGWQAWDRDGFESLLGPFWQKTVGDRLHVGILTEARHGNRNGVVHGGVTLALADQGLGLGAYTATGGLKQATIDLAVQFAGAVRIGQFLCCRPEVVRRATDVIFMRGDMVVGDRVVGSAQGIWKIVVPRA